MVAAVKTSRKQEKKKKKNRTSSSLPNATAKVSVHSKSFGGAKKNSLTLSSKAN
jgi:hypothetical protein